jgi:hypothetical protein
MPHATLKLIPGVDQNRTLALNESAISVTDYVRFVPDKQGIGLVQKLGGWTKFYNSNIGSPIRALWAWEDTNANQYLGVGNETELFPITIASNNGTSATITFTGTHDFGANDAIAIVGFTPDWYNGPYIVSSSTANTVTYDNRVDITGASWAANVATITYSGPRLAAVGETVVIASVDPNGYNGTYTVTAASTGSISYSKTPNPGAYVSGGKVVVTNSNSATVSAATWSTGVVTLTISPSETPLVGSTIVVSGISPSGYNGTYTVATSSAGSITYSLNSDPGAYVSGGTVTFYGSIYASDNLSVIYSGSQQVITPRSDSASVAVSCNTTIGSSTVQINATGSNINTFDTIDIVTQISVGGLILSGNYIATFVSANAFLITATDALGNPLVATSNVTNGGAVARYYTTSGQSYVDIVLYNHGYLVGDTFPALVSTTVGGITIYGNYTVIAIDTLASSGPSVGAGNSFRIIANTKASSTTNGYINGGNAKYVYYRAPLPLPTGTGYGVGGYGVGGYGNGVAPTSVPGTPTTSIDWSLDNWGDILIACPVYDITNDTGGQIYQWAPASGSSYASIIPQAPIVNDGCFVAMPQRQIIAWGSTYTGIQDPLLIRWCDVNDFNSWIPLVTNQAGSYRIPKGSRIVCGIQGPQQGLIWTDLGIWAMQYVGPPYVYQFNELGTGCGAISRKSAGSMNGVIYWMGQSQFFRLAGSGVEPIKCPIWDVIFQDLDTTNLSKIRIAPNSRFGEISWYYPTISNGGEINAYVKYNVLLDQWDFGSLARTAWINESVLGPPIGASSDYWIYQHETSPDADGNPINAYFQTGYFAMTEGEWKIFVDQVWPDMKWGYYDQAQSATLKLTFNVADYPGQTPRTYGPYTMTKSTTFLTPRFRGRLVSFKIESDDLGSFWRIGAMRYRFEQDGKF